jgi:hypothetical protein
MMISPGVIIVRRIKRPSKGRSIREISREYFKSERPWILAVELTVFAILTVIALWPILHVVAIIRAHPL